MNTPMSTEPRNLRRPRIIVPIALALVAVMVLVVVLVSGGSGSTSGDAEKASAQTSSTVTTKPAGAGGQTPATIPAGPFTTPNMPVQVTVSNTEHIASGTPVTIHAGPADGSETYGVEARLCRGDVAVFNDGLFTPTMGGACAPAPMTPDSDGYLSVVGVPPYKGIDLTFRVGAGSQTFLTQYSGPATVTCDASHPCQIVLKLQYPKAFGFQGLPVTFS